MSRDGTRNRNNRKRPRESMSTSEAYAIMGLEPGADFALVHAAYRELALEYHPDRGGSVTRFKELVAAYRVLKNRLQHDENGQGLRGECSICGNYDQLSASAEGEQCCANCRALSLRQLILPSPPVVIVSCLITIILQALAFTCLLICGIQRNPYYGVVSLSLGIAAMLALGVTCATVIYTAEPRHSKKLRK